MQSRNYFRAYGFTVVLNDERTLEKLLALNLERVAAEKSGAPKKRVSRTKSEEEFV